MMRDAAIFSAGFAGGLVVAVALCAVVLVLASRFLGDGRAEEEEVTEYEHDRRRIGREPWPSPGNDGFGSPYSGGVDG